MVLSRLPRSIEASDFVKPHVNFYPFDITREHNQLRQLVSSPSPDTIYTVHGKEVHRIKLNIKTREKFTELPFRPTCISTGYGYFCAGNMLGDFTYFRIPEGSSGIQLDGAYLHWWPHDLSRAFTVDDASHSSPSKTRVENICGNSIINSVSIHGIKGPSEQRAENVVALVTSNDCMVRMISLSGDLAKLGAGELEQQVIDGFDIPMNHASLSPDGRWLVIVGDHDYIHFYRRVLYLDPEHDEAPRDEKEEIAVWNSFTKVKALAIPNGLQLGGMSAFFTTAWNDSSTLCATGSEAGFVIVLDVARVEEADTYDDCLFAMGRSSRAGNLAGCIRSVRFTPDPWNLLIWTENNGRTCVADLGSYLSRSQTLKVNPGAVGSEPNFKFQVLRHFNSLPSTRRNSDSHRLPSQYRASDNSSRMPPVQELEQQHPSREMPPSYLEPSIGAIHGLSEEEREIIRSIRSTPRPRDGTSSRDGRQATATLNETLQTLNDLHQQLRNSWRTHDDTHDRSHRLREERDRLEASDTSGPGRRDRAVGAALSDMSAVLSRQRRDSGYVSNAESARPGLSRRIPPALPDISLLRRAWQRQDFTGERWPHHDARIAGHPENESQRQEWGVGIVGMVFLPGGEGAQSSLGIKSCRLIVATEEGFFEYELDYRSRKISPVVDFA